MRPETLMTTHIKTPDKPFTLCGRPSRAVTVVPIKHRIMADCDACLAVYRKTKDATRCNGDTP